MKKMMVGLSTAFILLVSISSSVFADGERRPIPRPPIPIPEPVSILLFVASGATYAGIRYLRARKNSKKIQ